MKKRVLATVVAIVTLLVTLTAGVLPASASVALPSISSSKYISTHTYASSGKVYAYKESSLKTKTGGYIACATDECRIIKISGNAVQVSYPVSGGRKTAWFARSAFTYRDLANDKAQLKFTATGKVTTYRWKEKTTTYGYIAKGDVCYLLRGDSNSNWLQILYPVSTGWKMAWAKGTDIVKMIWPTIAVTSVSLNSTSFTLTSKGATKSLTATVAPSNATTKTITWTSSNKSVATVNGSGVVTAVANGTTTITATSNNGKKATATCTVKIPDSVIYPTGVTVNSTSVSLTSIGATKQLSATVAPSNTTNKSVTWKSSDTSVATVSSTGLITAKGAGTCTITVTTSNNKKTTAKVTVTIASKKLLFPLKGSIVRSSSVRTNGRYCDYKASKGTPVYAPADGTVEFRQTYSTTYKKLASYGNSILFKSSDGTYTVLCAHLSSFNGVALQYKSSLSYPCSAGTYKCKTIILAKKTVKQGQLLGYTGMTGNASGPHVHIELKKNGKSLDPATDFTTWK